MQIKGNVIAGIIAALVVIGLVICISKNPKALREESQSAWTEYNNETLGFSIRIPRMVVGLDRCSDREFYVPTKVIENNAEGEVYIVPEYYYFEKSEGSRECDKVMYSWEEVKTDTALYRSATEPWLGIALKVASVKNDKELENLIQAKFGTDCSLGKKEFAPGEYSKESDNNVEVISGGMESNCPLNYRYKVLLADEVQKAMAVNLGQECRFPATADYGVCYDDLIMKSFQWK